MKIAAVVLSSLTILMALSQLICGLWIQTHSAPDSIAFHVRLGIATVIVAIVTVVVLLVPVFRR
jgi:hypothetical protein